MDVQSLSKYRAQICDLKRRIKYKEPPSTLKKSSSTDFSDTMREITAIKTAQLAHETRKELLEDGLRQRLQPVDTNMEQAVNHYENLQEKITEDMLVFTQSLKDQTQTANRIIKQDTKAMERSMQQTEKNLDVLRDESHRLQEHSKRAWKCWMWFMVAMVVAIFISMVLFMRVTKKRTS